MLCRVKVYYEVINAILSVTLKEYRTRLCKYDLIVALPIIYI